jgi:NADH:ubiquinone oxidoreductase subunit H
MIDLFFYLLMKLILLLNYSMEFSRILFFNIYSFFYFLDGILYDFSNRSDYFWFFYEKLFFYIQNSSFNYYSRIMWKPSLNISDHIFNVPIFFVLQTIFLVIMSVWARAVGPRMRMDQLSQLVWKDFVPSLTLILIVILIITVF